MKLTMVCDFKNKEELKLLNQLGIKYAIHYNMNDLPESIDKISEITKYYSSFGLDLKIVESGPSLDKIVLGKDGAKQQIERYKKIISHLGRMGIEIIVYNFMPQISNDAMVVRTNYEAKTRGGATTSQFIFSHLSDKNMPHDEKPIDKERMWENLENFISEIVPVAEDSGITMAMHPDDPPISNLLGLNRIMGTIEDYERLFSFSKSKSNAMTLCIGCFGEKGYDISKLINHFSERIAFIHVRNIRGTIDNFMETFPDDGQIDLLKVFQTLNSINYTSYIRSDHAPTLSTESNKDHDGYAIQGHIFTIGYLKGLIQAAIQS